MENTLAKIEYSWLAWFVGFVDGEGYFQICIQNAGRSAQTHLNITVREDDGPVLRDIQSVLGIGKIYQIDRTADRNNGRKSQNQYRWRVNRIQEVVEIVIPLFDEFPLHTKKASDYHLWREAAFLIHQGQHLNSNHHKLMELWAQSKANRVCHAHL